MSIAALAALARGQQLEFHVGETQRHRRRAFTLTLDSGEGALVLRTVKAPPLKAGTKRIAVSDPEAWRDAAETWDFGPARLVAGQDDRLLIEFGGRLMFGRYAAVAPRPKHWLLYLAEELPKQMPRFALSAGGIVVTTAAGAPRVALVKPRNKPYWTLPKGTVEPSEAQTAAALREVHEESGAKARILCALDPIEYWFWSREAGSRVRVHKAVAYYLMQADAIGDPTACEEIEAVEWCDFATARERISHDSEREVLEQGLTAWAELAPSDR